MFLGVDLGTGSLKAVILDSEGFESVGQPSSYSIKIPEPGAAEADPRDWWTAACATIGDLAANHKIEAMSLCGQMHGLVLVDDRGRLLRAPILWPDTRSQPYLDLYRRLPVEMLRRLANPIVTGMTGPSLLWVRQHEPDVYQSAVHVLQPKDYLRMILTGELACEPSDASATLMYDVLGDTWYRSLFDELGISFGLVPALNPSQSIAGSLLPEPAEALGLPTGLPVVTGAADTAAALLSIDLSPKSVLLMIGTGGQLVVARKEPVLDPSGATHLYRDATPSGWYAMAAIQNVGLALEWVIRVLGVGWNQAYAEAFASPPGSAGLLFAPYLTGERTPLLDSTIRSAWIGMGLDHDRSHLLRAAFEGVAFGLRLGLESLGSIGSETSSVLVAGGGATDLRWLQMLSDVLGIPVRPINVAAIAARGVAILAGTASGVDMTAFRVPLREGRIILPSNMASSYSEIYSRFLALYPALRNLACDIGIAPDMNRTRSTGHE